VKCEIQYKSDIIAGASLIIRIPEEELDRKALYTIQFDKPEFILPFHHRGIDGEIEFVYQVGTKSKLLYLAGIRSPIEYAQLWSGMLRPLLDCGDWFMKPYSFILDMQQLYYDKTRKTVSYLYVPSIRDTSDYCDLKEMAADFSKYISASDRDLENRVLRAIMTDFNPNSFIKMLKPYLTVSVPETKPQPVASPLAQYPSGGQTPALMPAPLVVPPLTQPVASPLTQPDILQGLPSNEQSDPRAKAEAHVPEPGIAGPYVSTPVAGDIVISLPAGGTPVKKKKENIKDMMTPGGVKDKSPRNPKGMSVLFGKKSSTLQDSLPENPQTPDTAHSRFDSSALKISDSLSAALPDNYSITQSVFLDRIGAWLRLVGSASLPPAIDVPITEGEVFTIGRFDTDVGTQQSSFEFDRKTKAVSRRHAALERIADRYNIIDLASSAGTFLNGQRLPPNTPCELKRGSMISFGNCGADYVWEGAG